MQKLTLKGLEAIGLSFIVINLITEVLRIVIFILLFLVNTHAWSQQTKKKFRFHLLVGGAYSQFRVGEVKTDPYPALEVRIGAGISGALAKRWAINSGINLGMKVKRKSLLSYGSIYKGKGVPDVRIDATASENHHYFIEIPLAIQFNHNDRLAFYTGVLGRSWAANDSHRDFLRSQMEVGFLLGGTRDINKSLALSIDLYTTLAPSLYMHTRNQFGQVKLIYRLE